jgi:hypothetical protein
MRQAETRSAFAEVVRLAAKVFVRRTVAVAFEQQQNRWFNADDHDERGLNLAVSILRVLIFAESVVGGMWRIAPAPEGP